MKTTNLILACAVLSALAACSSSKSIIREESAFDLKCDAADISVEEVESPKVGVVRYRAEGCGRSINYTCGSKVYVAGAPVGQRSCKRGDAPISPVFDPAGGVGF